MKKRTGLFKLAVPMMAAALTATACGSMPASSKMAAETTAAAANMAGQGAYGEIMPEMAAPQETGAFDTGSGGSSDSLTGQAPAGSKLPADRKLIRTVDLQAETDQFDTLLPSVQSKITELGGYIERSDISGVSMNYRNETIPRYAAIVARIPSDQLESFIKTVESDFNITQRSESTQDVTLQYSDIESRKKSLEVEQDRLWALLEKADSLDSVVALEGRLTDIRYQLESMQSQLRLYDNQVQYSIVNLYLNEVKDYTPTAPEPVSVKIQKGFLDNLRLLGNFIGNLCILVVTGLPIWLPLLLVLLFIIFIVRKRENKEQINAKKSRKNEQPKTDSSQVNEQKKE